MMDIIKVGDLRFWMTHNSARKATCAWLPEDDELRRAIRAGGIKVQRATLHFSGTKKIWSLRAQEGRCVQIWWTNGAI